MYADHDLWTDEYEECLKCNAVPALLAHFRVVEAVSCHAGDDVINQPEREEEEDHGNVICAEGTNGSKAPESVVGEEEVVGNKYESKRRRYDYESKNYSANKLFLADTNTALLKINGELLLSTAKEAKCKQTAEKTPQTDNSRRTLIPDA